MKTPYVRARATQATARRAENMRLLIAAFKQKRRLTFCDVMDELGMTNSGAWKYLRELRDAEAVTETEPRQYEIGSPLCVAAFERALEPPKPHAPPKTPQRKGRRSISLASGVFIHIMGDDGNNPRRTNVVPVRDPLVAALFGPVASSTPATQGDKA